MNTNRNQMYSQMRNSNSGQCNNMNRSPHIRNDNYGCKNMDMKTSPCARTGEERIDQFPIGMAYVPWQKFRDMYDPHMGLDRGTIFKELDYPFYGKRGNCP